MSVSVLDPDLIAACHLTVLERVPDRADLHGAMYTSLHYQLECPGLEEGFSIGNRMQEHDQLCGI